MTKITTTALTMALLIRQSKAACPSEIVLGESCDLASLSKTIESIADCTIAELFPEDAAAAVEELCKYYAPLQFVHIQGTYQRDLRYMNGGGTIKDGEDNFDFDVADIKRFVAGESENTLIGWPVYAQRENYNEANGFGPNGYMNNFNIDPDADGGSCQMNTAMCCFVENINADDFVDNSDTCRHDLSESQQSNHVKSGWGIFSGEEATHCVGFTWEEGTDSGVYKGNSLFYSSLYQTAMNGYIGNVPGAPMCACLEQMPVVTRADCVTATGTDLSYKFTIDADGKVAATHSVKMSYSNCAVNDLKAQVKEVHAGNAGIVAAIEGHLVGDSCADTNEKYLNNEQKLVPVQASEKNLFSLLDSSEDEGLTWKQIFGKGIFFLPPDEDAAAGDAEMRADLKACKSGDPGSHYCLIRRVCTSCDKVSHRDIVYKRLTVFPPFQEGIATDDTVDIANLFQNQWREEHNVLNVDYKLYSSVQNALNDTNAWTVSDYNTNTAKYGFPRNSGPHSIVGDQWNSYEYGHGHAHQHGFFIEVPALATSA